MDRCGIGLSDGYGPLVITVCSVIGLGLHRVAFGWVWEGLVFFETGLVGGRMSAADMCGLLPTFLFYYWGAACSPIALGLQCDFGLYKDYRIA